MGGLVQGAVHVFLDGHHFVCLCGQVADDVRTLGALAANMRRRRFAGGALRLDNVKLVFRLGADGNPAAAEPHVQREANQLVEVRGYSIRVATASGLQSLRRLHGGCRAAWPARSQLFDGGARDSHSGLQPPFVYQFPPYAAWLPPCRVVSAGPTRWGRCEGS